MNNVQLTLLFLSALFYIANAEDHKNLDTIKLKACGANEIFSSCGANACQNTCTNPTASATCTTQVSCIPGCICAPGFLRNSLGVCVLAAACDVRPQCNGPNEQFSFCGNDGCQRSCTRLDVGVCTSICNTPACICVTGFVRNSLGVCVTPAQCTVTTTVCTGQNEVLSPCGNDGCQRSCTRLDITGCIPSCSIQGCICATGFVRNSDGICVLPSQCPTVTPVCTRMNEYLSPCGNNGCQRSCTRFNVVGCIPVCSSPGCICVPGYVRNAAGDCVLPTACPALTCRTNEVFSYCGDNGCQPTCILQTVPTTCNPVCSFPACICATGFVRNSQGNCVLAAQCATTQCTRANEQFVSPCGDDGCQRSCSRLDVSTCAPMCSNIPACLCLPGFVRNSAGECVLASTCPTTCTGPLEVFDPCLNNHCQRTCATATGTPPCVGPASPGPCIPGCICMPGNLRNYNGVCVATANCNICPAGETLRTCGVGVCEGTCVNPGRATDPLCSSASECTMRCFCNAGTVRSNGVCIATSACP